MIRPFLAPGATPPAEPPRFPPRPTPNSPPRRRGLLGAIAALAAVPAVAEAMPAANPDAALLAACAEHARLAAEEARLLGVLRTFSVHDVGPEATAAEEAWDAAGDHAAGLLENIMDDLAATPDGIAAKARAVLTYWRTIGIPDENRINFEERGALSVLRDLERMTEGVA